MDKLIAQLLENGVYLSKIGDKLNIEFNSDSIPDDLLYKVKKNKNALLEHLSREDIKSNYEDITPVKGLEQFKLSSGQRRLWILSQFEGGSLAYNLPGSTYLKEGIEIENFKRAIDSTIDRHEILRTVFREEESGEIGQRILEREDLNFSIEYMDFRKEADKKGKTEDYITADAYRAFDLEKGPLLRAALLHVEEEEYLFYFNMHHIISDGWSNEVLSRDVFKYYEAYKADKEPDLKELKIQYKDYSAWQLAQLNQESFKAHREYWLDKLSGELPLLDLPSTKQRPQVKTYNGHGLATYLDKATTTKLKGYIQKNGGSLFMSLLASWKVLMYRYTSEKDIIIGSPVAGRDHADLEDQIGFYVNTLALRNEVDPQESFNHFYQSVKEHTLKSYNHQMYPFDRLAEELGLQRDTGRSPIFDISITYHNITENEDLEISDDTVINQVSDNGPLKVKNDIELHFGEVGDYIYFKLIFNVDVYEREMIERLMKHFKNLLNSILSYPEEKIAQIDYLSEEEKNELLVTFNDTVVSYPKDKTIVDLFEEQVAKAPDNIAIVFEDIELTYQELNERSNQLANLLRENYGITTEDLVGIQLDRTEWAIITVLAILKAGGAYVPIDPENPSSRKEQIVKDISLKLLITEANFIYDMDFYEGELFAIDVEFVPEDYSVEKCPGKIAPDNLAYVIHTSGSTGNPKGVMIEHHSLVDLSYWQKCYFNLDVPKKISQMGSFSFDASVGESVMALTNGGTLTLIRKENFSQLVEIINEQNIDVVVTVPSLLKQLDPEKLIACPTIVSVGEKCSSELYQRWTEKCHFVNGYGPTEYTVYSHAWHGIVDSLSVPIGKSRQNLKTYILDTDRELTPLGVPGEMYLSGPGLARAYLNNRWKTFSSFVPNYFYLDEIYVDRGEISNTAFKKIEAPQYLTVKEINERLDYGLSTEEIIFEIEKNFEGKLKNEAIQLIKDNDLEKEFTSTFLRYYYEGMFDNYKAQSISWEVFLKLTNNLAPLSKGIDLGCGSGELVRSINANGTYHITGIDANPFFVKKLINDKINGILCRIDMPVNVFLKESKLQANSMDFVVSTLTLDRVQYPSNLVRNMSMLLREGGRFILGTLLPIVAHEDGENQSAFDYTKQENRITPGLSEKEDRYYLVEMLLKAGIADIELFQTKIQVSSKNGMQDYTLFIFCGNKQEKTQVDLNYTRMYKTGDLGRWLSDGNIEFIGRKDDQIKIRGHRIELGEIEHALVKHEAVSQSVVVARENESGEKELVAYIVSNVAQNASDLRTYLKQLVPEYMLPVHFVQLEAIPLNTSGKIDKKALPDPEGAGLSSGVEYVAPGTEQEKVLVSVWSAVLKKEGIGIKDSFYNLGGDSIKSIQVVARLKQQGYRLKVEHLLRTPILEDLAGLMELTTQVSDQSEVSGAVVLTPIQEWFFKSEEIQAHEYFNQSVLLYSKEELDSSILEKSIEDLTRHHDALRMVYKQNQGVWEQFNGAVSSNRCMIHFYDLRESEAAQAEMAQLGEALQSSINLSEGPLLRVAHFRLKDGDRLGLIVHHLVVDGVSWRILLEDLSSLYSGYKEGAKTALPAKTDSFQRWALLQKEYASGSKLEKERVYWQQVCDHQIAGLAQDKAVEEGRAAVIDSSESFALDQHTTGLLQTRVHGVYNTEINDVLLTGLGLAL
ncbi:condensation domain-containing protein, partial [Flavobacterium sp. UGB4466]|uniref:condensation domain-containing protein n=1 Tax=Flavobacterium sp. UGB4466 TaxID=2730889 RepID=UPI00192C1571